MYYVHSVFHIYTFSTPSTKDNIKQNSCLLVILNGVPDYQHDQVNEEKCVNGKTVDGIVFKPDRCGIKFSHSNWKEKQTIKIFGQTDQLVNVQDRIIFLRLYNADDVAPTDPILYWKNIHLPDIKVCNYSIQHFQYFNVIRSLFS